MVRTSHYPQSQAFLDRCDELGLLVFTEIPGWQHIGGDAWKEKALRNVDDMVWQSRNHPCVILWGVRINESADDDELKAKTAEFRERVAKGESLDALLPEAYAAVKNACRRLVGKEREVCGHKLVWDMVPFDVQIMGGIVLHQGKIAEMQTSW